MKGLPAIQTPRLHPQARKECASGNAAAWPPGGSKQPFGARTPRLTAGARSPMGCFSFCREPDRSQVRKSLRAGTGKERAPLRAASHEPLAHPCIFKRPGYPVFHRNCKTLFRLRRSKRSTEGAATHSPLRAARAAIIPKNHLAIQYMDVLHHA